MCLAIQHRTFQRDYAWIIEKKCDRIDQCFWIGMKLECGKKYFGSWSLASNGGKRHKIATINHYHQPNKSPSNLYTSFCLPFHQFVDWIFFFLSHTNFRYHLEFDVTKPWKRSLLGSCLQGICLLFQLFLIKFRGSIEIWSLHWTTQSSMAWL